MYNITLTPHTYINSNVDNAIICYIIINIYELNTINYYSVAAYNNNNMFEFTLYFDIQNNEYTDIINFLLKEKYCNLIYKHINDNSMIEYKLQLTANALLIAFN